MCYGDEIGQIVNELEHIPDAIRDVLVAVEPVRQLACDLGADRQVRGRRVGPVTVGNR